MIGGVTGSAGRVRFTSAADIGGPVVHQLPPPLEQVRPGVGRLDDLAMNSGGQRLDGEGGYGLPIGSRFVGTPRAGTRTSEYGQDYRLGYSMDVLEASELKL